MVVEKAEVRMVVAVGLVNKGHGGGARGSFMVV